MPEGPEILFFSIFLKQKFLNYKISEIKAHTTNNITIPEDLEGRIVDITCKGKTLWFMITSSHPNKYYYLHIHLGLSGWIMFKDATNIKYSFNLESGDKKYNLYIEDKTKLSDMCIYNVEDHNFITINKLGTNIYKKGFTLRHFTKKIQGCKMLLAAFLLKQEIFCGIGNYIKNEVLYLCNLDVKIKTNELTDENIRDLYKNILFVAYSCLIEQLRNSNIEKILPDEYKENIPDILEVPYEYKIYKRNYTSDGKKVKKIKVSGRDTYYVEK
jgi:formamidopyrimidine-DNA glycosylase